MAKERIERDEEDLVRLYLTDIGYFTLKRMHEMTEQGWWWLTHAKSDLSLIDERGVKKTLVEFIK